MAALKACFHKRSGKQKNFFTQIVKRIFAGLAAFSFGKTSAASNPGAQDINTPFKSGFIFLS